MVWMVSRAVDASIFSRVTGAMPTVLTFAILRKVFERNTEDGHVKHAAKLSCQMMLSLKVLWVPVGKDCTGES